VGKAEAYPSETPLLGRHIAKFTDIKFGRIDFRLSVRMEMFYNIITFVCLYYKNITIVNDDSRVISK
jgi:hypothetical protein